MKHYLRSLLIVTLLFTSATYAGTTLPKLQAENPDKKLAIVSLTANNFSDSLDGWGSARTSELMNGRLNKMLQISEDLFAQKWQIIKAESFIKNPEYQKLAGIQLEVALPVINNSPMPVLAENRKQLIKAMINPDKAKALATLTGADFLVVIYSEWAVATGKFVPTSKALTKNVIGIYDASGEQVYFGRSDKQGEKTLGSFGGVVVDQNSIDQWVDAYIKGVTALSNGTK